MVYITEIDSFLPGEPIDNDNMESFLGFVDGKPSRAKRIVLRSNGIKSRHYAIDPKTNKSSHSNAELTAHAVRNVLKRANFELENLELLACGTSTPDQLMPSHASMVHGELGSHAYEVVSTAGVCCSAMAAMKYGYLSLLSGDKENAVIAGSDSPSKFMKGENFDRERVDELEKNPSFQFEQEFLRWMLSDGAGAFLLSNKPKESGLSFKVDWIDMTSYANELPPCMYAGALMNEGEGFRSWVDSKRDSLASENIMNISQNTKLLDKHITYYSVNKALVDSIRKHELKPGDIDWFVPHYSSDFFRKKLFSHLEEIDFPIPFEKWFTTLSTRGNVGAASIFIYLQDLLESQELKPGQKILCFIPESSRFSVSYMHLTVVGNQ